MRGGHSSALLLRAVSRLLRQKNLPPSYVSDMRSFVRSFPGADMHIMHAKVSPERDSDAGISRRTERALCNSIKVAIREAENSTRTFATRAGLLSLPYSMCAHAWLIADWKERVRCMPTSDTIFARQRVEPPSSLCAPRNSWKKFLIKASLRDGSFFGGRGVRTAIFTFRSKQATRSFREKRNDSQCYTLSPTRLACAFFLAVKCQLRRGTKTCCYESAHR